MKTSIIASAMILALAAAGQASANTGTITFNGEISDTTCTVTGGGNGNGSGRLTVNLPGSSTSELAAPGDTAGRTHFSIIVGSSGETGCTDGKTAKMHWDTSNSNFNANGELLNTYNIDPDLRADGLAVRLVNAAGNPINLNNRDDANNPAVVIADNTAELNFAAEYIRLAGTFKEGKFTNVLSYSVVYN